MIFCQKKNAYKYFFHLKHAIHFPESILSIHKNPDHLWTAQIHNRPVHNIGDKESHLSVLLAELEDPVHEMSVLKLAAVEEREGAEKGVEDRQEVSGLLAEQVLGVERLQEEQEEKVAEQQKKKSGEKKKKGH